MRIKKFRGKNILDALDKIKKEFGESAVILNSEQIRTEEGTMYEITAAIEEEEISIKNTLDMNTDSDQNFIDKEKAQDLLKEEIAEIKKMLKVLLEPNFKDSKYLEWIEKGMPPFIAKELIHTDSDLAEIILSKLKEKGSVPNSKYQVFIGDAGVGKTTNIFKLAIWYKCKYNSKVLVINLDNYKVESNFQTKKLAELLEIEVENLTLEEVKEIEPVLSKYKYVLFDTPSLGKRLLISDLENLIIQMPFLRFRWVVRAVDHYQHILNQWNLLKRFPVEGILLSFVDKIFNGLPLFWILDNSLPPITFISNGERIPEDILKAEEEIIKKILLKTL